MILDCIRKYKSDADLIIRTNIDYYVKLRVYPRQYGGHTYVLSLWKLEICVFQLVHCIHYDGSRDILPRIARCDDMWKHRSVGGLVLKYDGYGNTYDFVGYDLLYQSDEMKKNNRAIIPRTL